MTTSGTGPFLASPIEEYYVRAGFDFTKHSFAELAEKYMEDYVPASAACPLAERRH